VSIEEAFLRDIVEHPDDDAPRLAYADWLQEQRDRVRQARGEFIAVQCAIARDEERGVYRKQLKQRQRELLKQNRGIWLDGLDSVIRQVEFRRGFVERVMLADSESDFWRAMLTESEAQFPTEYLARVRDLFVREPAIRHLRLAPGEAQRNAELVPTLMQVSELPRLVTLALENNGLGPPQAPYLTAPGLVGLRRLLLNGNPLGDDGVRPLTQAVNLSALEALSLEDCRLSGPGTVVIARSPYLRRLRYLGLGENDPGEEGLRGLARTPALDALATLALNDCRIYPQALRGLVSGPLLSRLRKLDLRSNELGDEGAEMLARSPHLAGLRELDLSACRITDAGVVALADTPAVSGLEELSLSYNPFGDAGARALGGSRHLECLRTLHLSSCHEQGWIAGLFATAGLPALVELNLNHCFVHHEDMIELARSPLLDRLRILRLTNTSLTDEGARVLLESPAAGRLEELDVKNNRLGKDMVLALKRRFAERLHI
jgi:uncharacterized protein (TIGR02996 family)